MADSVPPKGRPRPRNRSRELLRLPPAPAKKGKATRRAMPTEATRRAMPKQMPSPSARAMERANPNARFKRAAGAPAKKPVPMRGDRDPMFGYRPPAKPKGGGIDLPKFASEVSGNYAKGVAKVGGEVNKAIAGARRAVGSNAGISNAMKTGADKNNPLHRILRNQTGGRK